MCCVGLSVWLLANIEPGIKAAVVLRWILERPEGLPIGCWRDQEVPGDYWVDCCGVWGSARRPICTVCLCIRQLVMRRPSYQVSRVPQSVIRGIHSGCVLGVMRGWCVCKAVYGLAAAVELWASGAHMPRCQQQGRPGIQGNSYWIVWVSKSSYWRNPHCMCVCIWTHIFYLRSLILISWSGEQDESGGGSCICVFLSLLIYIAGHMYMHVCVVCGYVCACWKYMLYYCLGLGMWSCSSCFCWATGLGTSQQNVVEEQL